ncbi:SNARE associated Golgi protein [Pseudonocardia ammonioxydans]|uniref:SNARE associated Golgi protein n=1 Tax=Pseudonocardia ammonioxydans TaxID=260086 RepID=A0A1I4VP53_PSUAM|nr:SNARE associated Golgi protein [Pseudonocardia ammonioxydans]
MTTENTQLGAIAEGAVTLMEFLGAPGAAIAFALYGLGAWWGAERLRRIVDRIPLLAVSDVDRAQAWFARHGSTAVFLGRMVPVVRSLISIPAGIERMPLLRFGVLTTAGSAVWNTVFVLAGYTLGENWGLVEQYAGVVQNLVVLVGVVAAAGFVVARVRGRMAS